MTTTAADAAERERIIKTMVLTAVGAAIATALWALRAHHRAPPPLSAERNRQHLIATRQRYIAARGGIEQILASHRFVNAHNLPLGDDRP